MVYQKETITFRNDIAKPVTIFVVILASNNIMLIGVKYVSSTVYDTALACL